MSWAPSSWACSSRHSSAGAPTPARLAVSACCWAPASSGGFTTYSALSLDTAVLLTDGRPGPAALYGLGSVVLGLLAAAGGVACGTKSRLPAAGTDPAPEAGGTTP